MLELTRVSSSADLADQYILTHNDAVIYVGDRENVTSVNADVSDDMFKRANTHGASTHDGIGTLTWNSLDYILHITSDFSVRGIFRYDIERFAREALYKDDPYTSSTWQIDNSVRRCPASIPIKPMNMIDNLDLIRSAKAFGYDLNGLGASITSQGLATRASFISLAPTVARNIISIGHELARTAESNGEKYDINSVTRWASAASYLLESLMPNGDIIDMETHLYNFDEVKRRWDMPDEHIVLNAAAVLEDIAVSVSSFDVINLYSLRTWGMVNIARLIRVLAVERGMSIDVLAQWVALNIEDDKIIAAVDAGLDVDIARQLYAVSDKAVTV